MAQFAWPRHHIRVWPPPALHVEADAPRGAGQPRQPRRPWATVQIEHHVVPIAPQPPAESQVVEHPLPAASAWCDDDLVQIRMVTDDGSRRWFDEVGEVRIRIGPPQCRNHRRREDHVADEAQTHDEHTHGGDYNAERLTRDV